MNEHVAPAAARAAGPDRSAWVRPELTLLDTTETAIGAASSTDGVVFS
jgi:hypothetical protein